METGNGNVCGLVIFGKDTFQVHVNISGEIAEDVSRKKLELKNY